MKRTYAELLAARTHAARDWVIARNPAEEREALLAALDAHAALTAHPQHRP
jgi:hypothetical protein